MINAVVVRQHFYKYMYKQVKYVYQESPHSESTASPRSGK
jgi:hypothetical protein